MLEISNLKKKKIFILSSFGHAGIDWISSLFDNHPEILIIPSLSFFRKIEKIKLKEKKFEKYNNYEKIKIFCDSLLKQSKKKSLRLKLRKINKVNLYKNIIKIFDKVNEAEFEKKLFYAVHYYFIKLYNLKLKKIKIIICHEHAPWNCKNYLKYFNAKLITVIRDPRAAISGSFRGYQRSKILSLTHRLEMTFCFLFHSIKNFNKYYQNNLYLISNEKFNKNLSKEMKKLSKWLNINFKNSMLKQTFLGRIWHGESSYKSKTDLKYKVEKNYYKSKNVKTRWLEYLNNEEIKFIEINFRQIFKIGNYKKKFNLSFFEKTYVQIKFIIMVNFFKKKNEILKINYIKIFIKKFLLIFLREKYNFFFKLI